tara:strand:+ start:528 stop:914 length:387 start_codon:yes stop_codon:yes gene_type:complete
VTRLDEYVKIAEAARIIGVSPNTLRAWASAFARPGWFRCDIRSKFGSLPKNLPAVKKKLLPPPSSSQQQQAHYRYHQAYPRRTNSRFSSLPSGRTMWAPHLEGGNNMANIKTFSLDFPFGCNQHTVAA